MTDSLLLQFSSIGNWKVPVRGVRVAQRPHPDLAATAPLSLLTGFGALFGSSFLVSCGVSAGSSSQCRVRAQSSQTWLGPEALTFSCTLFHPSSQYSLALSSSLASASSPALRSQGNWRKGLPALL